jgi:hypothetical protein
MRWWRWFPSRSPQAKSISLFLGCRVDKRQRIHQKHSLSLIHQFILSSSSELISQQGIAEGERLSLNLNLTTADEYTSFTIPPAC